VIGGLCRRRNADRPPAQPITIRTLVSTSTTLYRPSSGGRPGRRLTATGIFIPACLACCPVPQASSKPMHRGPLCNEGRLRRRSLLASTLNVRMPPYAMALHPAHVCRGVASLPATSVAADFNSHLRMRAAGTAACCCACSHVC
jgi:hypothetical protein